MKRLVFIITLLAVSIGAVMAQEYDSPEYVSLGREKARSKIVPYPTAEE